MSSYLTTCKMSCSNRKLIKIVRKSVVSISKNCETTTYATEKITQF